MKKSYRKNKIILIKPVKGLGKIGDIVEVKPGYARNWLLPFKYALKATEEVLSRREELQVQAQKDILKLQERAKALISQLEGKHFYSYRRADEAGCLYSALHISDILEIINQEDVLITRNEITPIAPIKNLGEHVLLLKINELDCHVKIFVQRQEIQG